MWYIAQHELRYYFKNITEAIYIYSYFVSIIFLSPFAVSPETLSYNPIATLALWIALASAVGIGAQRLFSRDREQGLLEYYQLLPVSLELFVLAKWLAFYLFLMLPLLASLPIAALFMGLSWAELGNHAVGLAVGAAALSVITTLLAALLASLEKAGALLSLLILPLSVPVLIFGAQYCREGAASSSANLLLLVGFAIFMLPIMCWAGASAIRSSN